MKKFLPLFLALFLFSCTAGKKTSSGEGSSAASTSEGSSYENAVVIKETNEMSGVSAEYAWLRKHYPGYQSQGQSLSNHNGKPYDIIKIKTANGEKKEVYFDISNFFGK